VEKQQFQKLYPWSRDTGEHHFADAYFTVDLPVSPEEIWPVLTDTSRLNRAIGLGRRFEEERDGVLHSREKILWGVPLEWIEHPWSWVQHNHATAEREYSVGPFHFFRCIFHVEQNPNGGSTVCVQFAWICKSALWAFLLRIGGKKVGAAMARVLERAATSLRNKNAENPYLVCTPITERAVTKRLDGIEAELLSLKLDATVVRSLIGYIKCGDEMDLYRIRPLRLAKSLKLPERELLRACIHGTKAGLLNLSWDIICPHCRGVREESGALSEISKRGHCDVCDIDFSTQSENSIEITFHVHPSIRTVEKQVFCSAEPAKKTHIKWQASLLPGQRDVVELELAPGPYRLREVSSKNTCPLTVSEEGQLEHHWDVAWNSDVPKTMSGKASYSVANTSSEISHFVLEELWWERDILRPGALFCVPEFQQIFSRDCLAAGVQLDLGNQSILFTDIVGSTKFYQDVGDAAAFATVVEHFEELTALILKHEGAVIKTIGDAVMAAFHTPDNCLKAASEAQLAFGPGKKVRLRISVHYGPVIAVNWNTGKDYFGHVVNFAAKMQSCAGAGEVAVSEIFLSKVTETLPFSAKTVELAVAGMKEKARVRVFDCVATKKSAA